MCKTIITADFHISESKRLNDTIDSLDFIVKIIESENPGRLVVLGDLFDKRKPTPKEMQVLDRWINKIKQTRNTHIYLVEGNHDQDRGVSSLSYIEDLTCDRVTILKPPCRIDKFYLGHEQIAGATADNGIILHSGSSLENIIKQNEECCVFAFGHFHKPQVLHAKPVCFYSGSITKTNFGERNDEKCLWIFEDTELINRLIIPTRLMCQFNITAFNYNNHPYFPTENLNGALIKVVIQGVKSELARINEQSIKDTLFDAGAKEVLIYFDVQSKSKSRNEKINESITEEDALTQYFLSKKLPDKVTIAMIVNKGIELIKESNL